MSRVTHLSQFQEMVKASKAPPRLQHPLGQDVIDGIEYLYGTRVRPQVIMPGRPLPGLSNPGSAVNRAKRPGIEENVVSRSLRNQTSRVPKLRNARTL
jgi:hypothetical protein